MRNFFKNNSKKIIVIISILIFILISIYLVKLIIKNHDENWKKLEYYEETNTQIHEYKLYEFGNSKFSASAEMSDIVRNVVKNYTERIDFEYIDVITKPNLSNKYMVNIVPTFIIVDKEGKVKNRITGKLTEEDLSSFIEGVLKNKNIVY